MAKKTTTVATIEAMEEVQTIETAEVVEMAEVIEDDKPKIVITLPVIPNKISDLFMVGDQEVKKEMLRKRIKETEALTIDGVKDTKGLEQVRLALAEIRTTRTTLEKVRKEKTAPINTFLKAYKAQVDELGEICQKAENALDAKIKAITDEKERIKKEKELEKLRIMQARIQGLLAVGAVSDPENGTYSFPFALQYFTNDLQVQEMDDEEYNEFLADVTECYHEEQKRIQKEKDDKEAEELRIKNQGIEQAAEATRLNAKRTALRIKELQLMGFVLNEAGTMFSHEGSNTHLAKIATEQFADDIWDASINSLEAEIEDAQNRKEAEIIPEGTFSPDTNYMAVSGAPEQPTVAYTTDGKQLTETDVELLVQQETAITDITELFDNTQFAVFYGGSPEFEDLHVAKQFFVRLFMTCRKEESLSDVAPERIISRGQLNNPELSWALIKIV